ncbi:peptidylprolyl isomerase [Neorhizobium sp. JUb45]|uniref:peptidylprolyl isomerase n=1 Tax=unclassified Neorhizobium TaxID=2629175 RepID=UPI00104AFD3C|nr:peptidylprolyl isomerase [Neorhizobium sp. JUb45]TCR05104.1 peptidyl-prolyl cis-trans isomerase D [Neorhizobium sp. JUb45]
MLDSLRTASRSWVAKALLMLLGVSFGIWGVSASIMAPAGGNSVMTVGDQSVTPQEYRLAMQRQLSQLSRQFGTHLTAEQARAFGIDQQVFSQLAAGAALDQLASDMRLGLSDDRLALLVADDPAFKNSNGQFDRQMFSSRLQAAGLDENEYIKERKKIAVRSQIVDAVSDGFTPPAVMVDALRQYADEARAVDYLILSYANIPPVKAPADDVLAAWFEGAKARYRAPEYRKVTYVTLQPSDVADPTSITDEQVQADYDRRKDSFGTPETRSIEQLTFPSKEMADAAAGQLASRAVTFDQLVKDQGKTEGDVLLGEFTKEQVPDPKVGAAAFALPVTGGTSPAIQGTFGAVILRVSNVKPATTKTFDEVKEEIRGQLALSAASRSLTATHDRFDDLRGTGATLQEAANELKLKTATVTIDQSGNDESGNRVATLPQSDNFLPEAFRAEIGADTLPVNLGNTGYVWFNVDDVIAERDRPLAEVREKAVADWTSEQQKAALAAKADEYKKRIDSGEPLATIASEIGITVENKQGLRRASTDAVFGQPTVQAAFAGPVDSTASALAADNESRLLMKVTSVEHQPASGGGADDQQVQQMARAAGDDMLDQMVTRLQQDFGVQINQTAAEQALATMR